MRDSFKMNPKLVNQGIREIKSLLVRYGMGSRQLAENLQVQSIRISEILHGKRRITADTDLRLARFFELPEGYFLDLQSRYDLAAAKGELAGKLEKIKRISETAAGWKTQKGTNPAD